MLKGIGKIMALFMSIVMIGLLFVVVLLFSLNNVLSKDSIKNIVGETKISDMKMSDITGNTDSGEDKTIKEEVASQIVEIGIPEDVAQKVAENDSYNQLLQEYMSSYSDYLINGTERPNISQEEIDRVVNENITIIEQETNTKIDTTTKDKLNSQINDMSKEIEESLPTVEEQQDSNINKVLDYIKKLTNNNLKMFVIVCIIITFIAIGLLTWDIIAPLLYSGICFIFVGITYILVSVVGKFIGISSNNDLMYKLINNILGNVTKTFMNFGIGLSIAGILFIVIYVVVKKIMDKKGEIEEA